MWVMIMRLIPVSMFDFQKFLPKVNIASLKGASSGKPGLLWSMPSSETSPIIKISIIIQFIEHKRLHITAGINHLFVPVWDNIKCHIAAIGFVIYQVYFYFPILMKSVLIMEIQWRNIFHSSIGRLRSTHWYRPQLREAQWIVREFLSVIQFVAQWLTIRMPIVWSGSLCEMDEYYSILEIPWRSQATAMSSGYQ